MTTTTTAPAPPAPERHRPWKKIVATGAVLIGGGALIAGGAFAIFTDSDDATIRVDAGALDIIATGDYTVADIAPGDTVERPILLQLPDAGNDGDLVSAVRFFYEVTGEVLGTDDPDLAGPGESIVTGPEGLRYTLQTCVGGAWTTAGADGVGPYDCAGDVEVTGGGTLASIDGVDNAVDLTPADFGVTPTDDGTFPSDGAGVTLNTLMVLELPLEADNDYEDASAEVTFTAAAIQRDGLQR